MQQGDGGGAGRIAGRGPAGAGGQRDHQLGGDYITHVDGKPVKQADDVLQAARKKHAGESIELTILRAGRSMKVNVTLAALDSQV
ncbi:MAG: PDZ domain-containing protein [Acidobacteriota bacterium]